MTHIVRTQSVRRFLVSAVLAVLLTVGMGGRALADGSSDGNSVSGANSETHDSSARNFVQVVNREDGQMRVDGSIQLNHIYGPKASPFNEALAYSSCNGCSTFAVALQINLISASATTFAPENYAVPINYKCTGCYTEADAVQYNITVADPNRVAHDEKDLIQEMSDQLRQLRSQDDLTPSEVHTRINSIIDQFKSLAASLTMTRHEETDKTTPGASAMH